MDANHPDSESASRFEARQADRRITAWLRSSLNRGQRQLRRPGLIPYSRLSERFRNSTSNAGVQVLPPSFDSTADSRTPLS